MKKVNYTLLAINIATYILWTNGYKAAEWFITLLQETDLIAFGFMILVCLYEMMKGASSMFSENRSQPRRALTDAERKANNEYCRLLENERMYYRTVHNIEKRPF
jgi:hypothetical protein